MLSIEALAVAPPFASGDAALEGAAIVPALAEGLTPILAPLAIYLALAKLAAVFAPVARGHTPIAISIAPALTPVLQPLARGHTLLALAEIPPSFASLGALAPLASILHTLAVGETLPALPPVLGTAAFGHGLSPIPRPFAALGVPALMPLGHFATFTTRFGARAA